MGFENGHLLRVAFVARNGQAEVVNTCHYETVDGVIAPAQDAQSLANRLGDAPLTAWKALFPPSWTVEAVAVTDEKDPLAPNAERHGWLGGVAGPGTAADLNSATRIPNPMCGLLRLGTGLIGRRFRGRMFLPPVWDESNIQDGIVAGVKNTAYIAFSDALPLQPDIVEGFNDGATNMVVYSRVARAANQDPYAAHVVSKQVVRTLHWLRSRNDGI